MKTLFPRKQISLAVLSLLLLSAISGRAQTWILDDNGNWSDSLNWLGGAIPDAPDATADFSTLDILGQRTVTLDSSRTVGHLVFGDLLGTQGWLLNPNGDATLALQTSIGAPTIHVINSAFTNRTVLAGTQGFVKLGAGSLTLQGSANVYSGATVVSNGTIFLNQSAGVTAIPGDLQIHSGATMSFTTAADQIADTAIVTVNDGGTLNLNNRSDTIATLILDGGVLTNNSGSPALQVTDHFDVRSGAARSILAGSGKALFKTTAGTAILSANNTYSGGTLINAGTLQIGDGANTGTPGATSAAITNNAQLTFNRGAGSTLSISGVISGSGSVTKLGEGTVALTGANTYSGSTTISDGVLNINGSSTLGDGTGIVNLSGGALNSTANRSANNAPVANPIHLTTDSEITTTSSSGTVDLNFTSSSISATAGTLTFRNDGANDPTDSFEPRFSGGDFVFDADIVIDNGAVGSTRLNSFNTNGTTQTFNGAISGNGGFRKSVGSGSGGTTIFNGNNSYSGVTTVNDGVLLVNGTLGTNSVTISSGATLGGTGTIHGPVVIQSGGELAPGITTGILTISNSLTLSSGSKTLIDINAAAHSSDFIKGLTDVAFDGTLQLNISGNLTGGESFQLFAAQNYSGTFGSIVPATPGEGLIWNTNNLAINGTLSVVSTNGASAPNIKNLVRLADHNVQFSFAGSVGANYRIWASTNLALSPVTDKWTLLTSGTFDLEEVSFTDLDATNFTQRFYLITVP
ncbi:MAG TPA: autotransporter-associated beta strand repeat-containing protein [Verrucomicrobiae bacterium]|nr:autotransporter-associated beta strand repeat-containing protein [Verrucomicrobiae bacterium]